MDTIYVCGVGMTPFGRYPDKSLKRLSSEAGARQVEGATVAVQENGGGLYGYEEAVAVLNMFAR